MIDFHNQLISSGQEGYIPEVYETATLQDNLEHSGGITLSWKAKTDDEIPIGTYIKYPIPADGQTEQEAGTLRYILLDQYAPTRESKIHYLYNPTFKHPTNLLDRVPFWIKMKDAQGQDLNLRTTSFTGLPHTIAQKLCDFMAEYANETGDEFFAETVGLELEHEGQDWDATTNPWKATWTFNIPDTNDKAIITVPFDGSSIKGAANAIADAMACNIFWDWNTKRMMFVSGTTITGETYNCFHVLGGTTNMGKTTTSGGYAAVTQRLTLADPVAGQDTFVINGRTYRILKDSIISGAGDGMRMTKDLILDDVYPKMELYINTARQRLCRLTDENGNFIVDHFEKNGQTVSPETEGATPIYKKFAKWYVTFKYSDGTPYVFDQEKLINDKALGLLFQIDFETAANTSPLAGRQFDLTYFPAAKTEWDKNDDTDSQHPFQILAGEFYIAFTAEGEQILPGMNTEGMYPKAGDKVTLVNVALTSEEEIAKTELLDSAKEIIGLMTSPSGEYTETMFFSDPASRVSIGSESPFDKTKHGPIVTSINHNLDTDVAEVTVGAWSRKTKTGGTADKLETVTVSANAATTGGDKVGSGDLGSGYYGQKENDTITETQIKPDTLFTAQLSIPTASVDCTWYGKVKKGTNLYTRVWAYYGTRNLTDICNITLKTALVSGISVHRELTASGTSGTAMVANTAENLSDDRYWLRIHINKDVDFTGLSDMLNIAFAVNHQYHGDRDVTFGVSANRDGKAGIDGDGVEFVFVRTTTNAAPYITNSSDTYGGKTYLDDEYLPLSSVGRCTDNPQGTTRDYPYEWVAKRTKAAPSTSGTTQGQRKWEKYSGTMSEWSNYAENAMRLDLSNEMDMVQTDSTGKITAARTVTTIVTVFDGAKVTKNAELNDNVNTLAIGTKANGTANKPTITKNSDGTWTITWTFAVGDKVNPTNPVDIDVLFLNVPYTAEFTLAASMGQPVYQLNPTLNSISFSRKADNTLDPTSRQLGLKILKIDANSTTDMASAPSGYTVRYSTSSMPASKTAGTAWGTSDGTTGITWSSNVMTIASSVTIGDVFIALFFGDVIIDRETIPILKDGANGKNANRPAALFRWEPNGTTPTAPTVTAANWVSGTGLQGWSKNAPDRDAEGYNLWMTQNTLVTSDAGAYSWENNAAWSTPVRISGDTGTPGEDGDEREWIYSYSSTGYNGPKGQVNPSGTAQGSDTNKNQKDWVPNGWRDNPAGVTNSNKTEYASWRDITNNGTTKTYGAFNTPLVWSHYGERGIDGDGVEYVFMRTTKNVAPTINATQTGYDVDEYKPPITNQTAAGAESGTCTDDPKGTTSTWLYEWVAKRTKGTPDADGKRSWTQFPTGAMSLWANWSKNAVRIDLDNENDSFLYTSGGSKVPSTYTVISHAHLYDGSLEVTSSATWTMTASGCTLTSGNSTTITVSAMTAETGSVTAQAVYNGVTYTAILSLKKIVDGDKYDLVISPNAIAYNVTTGLPAQTTISIQVWKMTCDGTRALSEPPTGYAVSAAGTNLTASSTGTYSYKTTNSTQSEVLVKIANGSNVLDAETIPINKSENGKSITKTSETYRYATNNTGTRPAATSADWKTTKPTLAKGYWLYTETTITWSDNSTTVLYTDERNPNDGIAGQDIIVDGATVMKYYVGDSNTTHPADSSSEWKDLSQVTQTQGKWLWSQAKTNYKKATDGTSAGTSYNYNVSYISKDGINGRAVTSTTEYYKATNSSAEMAVPTSDAGWSTNPNLTDLTDKWDANHIYLWNYEKVTYSSGTTVERTKPQILAIWTKDGKGIDSITNYYKITNSVIPPSRQHEGGTGWDDDPVAPTVDKPYLWNYEMISWTEGSPTYTDAQMIGHYGRDGRGITSVNTYFKALASQPSAPTGAPASSGWADDGSTLITKANADAGYHLYESTCTTYTNSTYSWTTPLDDGLIADMASTSEEFALSNSSTTAPTTGWAASVQPTAGKWVWSRTVLTFKKGDKKYVSVQCVGYCGVDGNTPTVVIGDNKHWFINGIDTGVVAEGKDGTGVEIKGEVATTSAMESTGYVTPVGGTRVKAGKGDCYVCDANRHLYMWDGSVWVDLGEFQGEPGKSSYMHIAYATSITFSGSTVSAVTGFTVDNAGIDYDWWGFCTDNSETDPGRGASSTDVTAARKYKWNYMKGKDGNGTEYIYLLTKEGFTPTINQTSGQGSPSADEFLPAVANYTAGKIYGNSQYWCDDPPASVSADWPMLWWAKRDYVYNSGTGKSAWGSFGSVMLHNKWSKDGDNGESPLAVYAWNQSATTGPSISGNAYPPSGWSKTAPNRPADGYFLWMSTSTKHSNGTIDNWSTPVRISGDTGSAGEDAKEREWVYKVNDTNPGSPSNPTDRTTDDYVPTGWSDNPSGVTSSNKTEWASWRDFNKSTKKWGDFNAPIIWSHYGERGMDGDGVEYVFFLTKGESYVPTVSTSGDSSSQIAASEYRPRQTQTGGNYNNTESPSRWTDDPTGVSSTWPVEWVTQRRKVNGAWGAFGTPAVWAKYSFDGKRGDFKSTVFKRYATAPSTPTGGSYDSPVPSGWSDGVPDGDAILWASACTFHGDGTNSGWSTPKQMTDTADFDVEFSSVANPNPPSGHPNTNTQWSNTSDSTTIWMATSECHNGVWSAWQVSKIKGEKGQDADVWTIGPYGYWYKNGVKQNTKAEGKDGTGVEIKGTVATISNLPTTGVKVGDCYIVNANRHLYSYNGTSPASGSTPAGWTDLGEFKGEPGEDGKTYYTHFAYADTINLSANPITGTGFRVDSSGNNAWMGLCVDENQYDPGSTQRPVSNPYEYYEWNKVEGKNSIRLALDNEHEDFIYSDSSTDPIAPSGGATSQARLYDGSALISASSVAWKISCNGGSAFVDASNSFTDGTVAKAKISTNGLLTVAGIKVNAAKVVVKAVYPKTNGQEYFAEFTANKSTDDKYDLNLKPSSLAYNSATYQEQTIRASVVRYDKQGNKTTPTVSTSSIIAAGNYYIFYGYVDDSGDIGTMYNLQGTSKLVTYQECWACTGIYFELRYYNNASDLTKYRLCDYETVEIAKAENGADGQNGHNGSDGLQGCVVRVSEWKSGVEYRNDEGATLSAGQIGYIDVVAVTAQSASSQTGYEFYRCKETHSSSSSNAPSGSGNQWWEYQQNVGPIYTSLLIAKYAYIKFGTGNQFVITDANGVVKAGMKGTSDWGNTNGIRIWAGSATSEASDANIANAPFRVYNDGSVVMTNADVKGSFSAEGGLVRTFSYGYKDQSQVFHPLYGLLVMNSTSSYSDNNYNGEIQMEANNITGGTFVKTTEMSTGKAFALTPDGIGYKANSSTTMVYGKTGHITISGVTLYFKGGILTSVSGGSWVDD